MRPILGLIFALTLSAGAGAWQDQPVSQAGAEPAAIAGAADIVIWGGPIHTADDNQPLADAVAIRNGKFVFVGARAGAEALVGPETTVLSLDGAALFPGFVDAHAHMAGIGERELTLNLEGTPSIAALQKTVAAWRAEHQPAILVGRGWIETHWPEGRFPSRWDIDAIVSDIPVILGRSDGHALVANSKALEMAGITGHTAAPYGGEIIKNALGEPTGMIVDAAMALVWPLIPATTDSEIRRQLSVASDVYARYGWTGLHNMSVPWAEVEALEALADAGEVKIRVYNSVEPQDAEKLFTGGARTNSDGRIITRAIKLYMDGALGSRGAALLAPYADADTVGLLQTTREATMPILLSALSHGIQVNMHAIGDRGNRLLLDWYEEAMNAVPEPERAIANPRWRDEHSQIVSPADIPRFAALGVIPSMQPSHAIGDFHFAPARLGADRLNGAYAWASLIKSGSIIAGGSDAPVERGDPRIEFYAAAYRHDLTGFQGPDWHPEEAVTREQALKMFTLWPAMASFAENHLGSITVGKDADLTAFSADLMTIPAPEILTSEAIFTMVKGAVIFMKE